jgi:hypothetical protein
MYFVTINQDKTVVMTYAKDVYVDDGVELFPITEEDFQKIWASGRNGDWILQDGALIHNPTDPLMPDTNEIKRPKQLPVEIL